MSNFLEKAYKPLRGAGIPAALALIALLVLAAGCDTGTNNSFVPIPITGFVPVTDIVGPSIAFKGEALTLSGSVVPANATNQAIAWAVKTAGSTGVTIDTDGTTLTAASSAGMITVTATIANGLGDSVPYTKDFEIEVIDAGSGGANPFGDDSTPIIWIMEKNEKTPPYSDVFPYATVLVTIKDTEWKAVADDALYNSGGYSRIGGIGARWEVTGGDELGNEGIAVIKSGKMIVANLTHTFSDMNGTFAKLTRTTSLEETWISSEPAFSGYYMKIEAKNDGNFSVSVSPPGPGIGPSGFWYEMIQGEYTPGVNPADCTIKKVNTGLLAESGDSWTVWGKLTQAQKQAVGGSETITAVVHDDKCTVLGVIFYPPVP
jgi:hypothetical protein